MFQNNTNFKQLTALGQRLKALRQARGDTQAIFAQRMGISRPTYINMEKGKPSVPIGNWMKATQILNREQEWDSLFKKQVSLFEQYEQQSQLRKTKRG